MSTERRWFRTHLVLGEPIRRTNITPDRRLCFEIILHFYNAILWNDECIGYKFIARTDFLVRIRNFKQLYKRPIYANIFARHLTKVGFPKDEQPASIEKIFGFIDVAEDPEVPIVVKLCDITSHYSDSEPYDYIIEMMTRESFETCTPKFIPATKSSIEGLEIVRFDCLEKTVIRQTPSCVICMGSLDHHLDININAAEDQDHHDQPMMITRLPCLHHFHRHCIIQWLEISHLCPLCRYPLPIMEVGESSKRRRLS